MRSSHTRVRVAFISTAQLLLNDLKYRTLTYPPPLRHVRQKKIPLVSMGAQVEDLTCADPGAKAPIGTSGNFLSSFLPLSSSVPHTFLPEGFMLRF